MAPQVKQLSEDLIARIAAGEVVERPASVIKELVENSLDAGSTHIAVVIEGAGRTLIHVSDNGCGMSKEDALLALRRHATSKISKFEDLEALNTFGFRGEALPSIAAVSKLTLTTRTADASSGWEFVIEGGKLISEKPIAREPGTTIDVRDIFFNTPARFKFLKSDPTERAQCLRVMEEMIFSSTHVTFELQTEKEKPIVFRANKENDERQKPDVVKTRLTEAWGARWARSLLPVFKADNHFRVAGVVSNQSAHQTTTRYQFLYINGRPVQNRRLSRAIYDAYQGQLPSLRHPAWALFLDLDPATIDVNVHPSKREVKITHESELYGFLNSAIKAALRGESAPMIERRVASFLAAPAPSVPLERRAPPSSTPWNVVVQSNTNQVYKPLSSVGSSAESVDPLPGLGTSEPHADISDLRDPELVVLGQIRKTYIVAQTRNGLLIVDQHAAAECAAYERLMFNLKAEKRPVQMLLVPFTWEVAMSLLPQVQENLDVLARMGFVIEPFGGSTFVIKGVPAQLREKFDVHSLMDGLSDELESHHRARDLDHRLAAMAACKSSVKAGDPLDNQACAAIINQLTVCNSPFTCPHGRPTVIRTPYTELDRRFRRA